MKKIRHRGIDSIKEWYGLIMISPWIFGIIVFFAIPIIQSIWFSFSDISIEVGEVLIDFKGLSNYDEIINKNPDYIKNLFSALTSLMTSFPFILVVSIVLALLLNGSYFGRIFFRGLYFIPVVIASGAALKLFLRAASSSAGDVPVSDVATFGMMMDFGAVLKGLNLPAGIENYLSTALSNIFLLVWQSGIQTILIIAGLQSIPDLLYEVAKVEGATKWEEFWYITIPMLSRTLLIVIVFTIVELISSDTNKIVTLGYDRMALLEYGLGSAMLWFYFAICGAIIALFLIFYNKVFIKRWN